MASEYCAQRKVLYLKFHAQFHALCSEYARVTESHGSKLLHDISWDTAQQESGTTPRYECGTYIVHDILLAEVIYFLD